MRLILYSTKGRKGIFDILFNPINVDGIEKRIV